MTSNSTALKTWGLRLLALDGALPLVVVILPQLVQRFAPKNPDAIILFATLVLAIGCIYRFYSGRRHILTNGCGPVFRIVQTCSLTFGVTTMVLYDCLIMIQPTLLGNGLLREAGVLAFFYCIYLACMIVALYPGMISTEKTKPVV